jgi:Mn2+/Fe2+ NRAMP family transporter
MNMTVTLALMAAGVAATVGCGWMGARPKDYLKPRVVPWQLLMLVGAVFVLVMLIHLLTLFGMNTSHH